MREERKNRKMNEINMRVEFEIAPIRHLAVQCPSCENWFCEYEITGNNIHNVIDAKWAIYHCPICHTTFKPNDYDEIEITQPGGTDKVYEGVKQREEKWV